jgi:hypothetical protein
MKVKTIIIVLLLTISVNYSYSQDDEVMLGKEKTLTTAAFYDLSDPMGVNIEVNLLGFVPHPGRYKIPYNTTILDLLSFSGGPAVDTDLKDIRIVRPGNDSLKTKITVIKLNYDDLLWEDEISQSSIKNPVLKSGDLILVKQEKRYTLRDNLLIVLPIVSTLFSIVTFIITLSK